MRLPEQRLWDTMRGNKPPDIVLERVENIVGEGMPDVYALFKDGSKWIELKAPNGPVRDSTRVLGDEGLRQSQKNWHIKAFQLGLPSYILIRERRTKRLWLIHGSFADEVNDMNADKLDYHSLGSDWATIFKVIKQ